jgi:hypothetical protein
MTASLITLSVGLSYRPDSGELRKTAQIIPFRDYQIPRDVAPMNGDIETRLAELNHMAAEIFEGFMIDTVAAEYTGPDKNLLLFFQALCEELPTRDVVPRHTSGRSTSFHFRKGGTPAERVFHLSLSECTQS